MWGPVLKSITRAFGSRLPGKLANRDEPIRPELWLALACVTYWALAVGLGHLVEGPETRLAMTMPDHLGSVVTSVLTVALVGAVGVRLAIARGLIPGPVRPVSYPHMTLAALSLLLFQGTFGTVKTTMSHLRAFAWDRTLADLDAALHLGQDPWRLYLPLAELIPFPVLQFAYMPLWYALAALVPLLVLLLEPDLRQIRRFFFCYFTVWIGIGNLVACGFLSGGPVFYVELAGSARFEPLIAWIDAQPGSLATLDARQYLWSAQESGVALFGSGIAAMPSVHVGLATLFALYAWHRLGRAGRVVGVAWLALIQLGSVVLGWHYAIDGYVSMALIGGLWLGLAPRRSSIRRGSAQAGAAGP